jgi:uncharacterized protein (TIGR00661 family)
MKILYGVQGTGNGHIARARVMAKAMQARDDMQVDFLFTGRDTSKYFDMQVFGDYRTRNGLTFVTTNGSVNRLQTFMQAKFWRFYQDVKNLDLSSYDLVLNDFEPVSAWAAKRQGVPAISISHQACFSHAIPKQDGGIVDRAITRNFAPTSIQLGVHWYHFGFPIMPPFIEEQPLDSPTNTHILVYLPFEELNDIEQMLKPLSEQQFKCFHPELSEDRIDGNIEWKCTSKPLFREALLNCSGVIANAGFELSSEAIRLGKKLLIKPLAGQFEQVSNLITLLKLELCTEMLSLDSKRVEQWTGYPQPEPIRFPNSPDTLLNWLVQGNWQDTQSLCDKLWQQVEFPPAIQAIAESL